MQPIHTLPALLRWRSQTHPHQRVYTFLTNGENEIESLTYADLDQRARAIGALLQEGGAANKGVLLLYEPGLEYIGAFFGCLYAGAIAIPAYPPRANRSLSRLQAIVADSQAAFVLTTRELLDQITQHLRATPQLGRLRWFTTNQLEATLNHQWQEVSFPSTSIAFLQYTSGSTASPKGVILSHENLLHNSAYIQRTFGTNAESRGMIWLPPYHDMGLIGGIIQPLYSGFPVTLMSPVAFLQRPLRWLEAISRFKATVSGGPNFAYDLCIRKNMPEQQAQLDLSSWQVAFNGAEPVRSQTLDQFAELFAPCGFRRAAFMPCYGLAEATLMVTGGERATPPLLATFDRSAIEQLQVQPTAATDPDHIALVSCGSPAADQALAIVDPQTGTRCLPDQIGEIWVSGPSVAQGYWQQPTATSETFHATLPDEKSGAFVRTGDLGFLYRGQLFVAGRIKDLIIIRGRNLHPQDIEQSVESSYPGLRHGAGAAFSIDRDHEERLIVVQEVERQLLRTASTETVIDAIRQAVAEKHAVQVYAVVLIKPGSISKTSSGKVQRYTTRDRFLAGTLDVIANSELEAPDGIVDQPDKHTPNVTGASLVAAPPEQRRQALDRYIASQIARALKHDPASIDAHKPLSTFGLDSLMAVEVQYVIEAELGVTLPVSSFLDGSVNQISSRVLAALLTPASKPATTLLPAEARTNQHPLSYGQRAIWLAYQLAPESAAHNIHVALRIGLEIDLSRLCRALETLLERHAILRTIYVVRDGTPMQQIHAQQPLPLQAVDAATWNAAELQRDLAQEADRPFDLEQGPVLRVKLYIRSAQESILSLTIDHIAADLWSLDVLIDELQTAYSNGDSAAQLLPPVRLHYTDYVRWQSEMLAGPQEQRLWAFWQQQVGNGTAALNLPTDRPRPLVQGYDGASYSFELNGEVIQCLRALAATEGATLFMTLLAAFQALLYRYTYADDILVGTPVSGRSRVELEGLVGCFVNHVVVRARVADNPSFRSLLQRTRATTLAAFDHQEYPLPLLIERLRLPHDASRASLFQVAFVWGKLRRMASSVTDGSASWDGQAVQLYDMSQRGAAFDLTLTIFENERSLGANFQYNTTIFLAATIGRLASHFQTLLHSIAADPDLPVVYLPLLTERERHLLLVEWNDTSQYPDQCLHQLFELQAARDPHQQAICFEDEQITYGALNAQSNQIAHGLRDLGVSRGQPVAILLAHGPLQIGALMGVLKAGGAFVCLDPGYPPARLQSVLDEVAPQIIICDRDSLRQHPLLLEQHRRQHPRSTAVMLGGHSSQLLPATEDSRRQAVMGLDSYPTTDLAPLAHPRDPAYIVYTSGSTGQPKGIVQSHRSFCQFLTWQSQQFHMHSARRIAQWASVAYDASYCEIFGTLCFGATLCLAAAAVKYDPARAIEWVRDAKITLLQVVPSFCRPMLQLIQTYGRDGAHAFPDLDFLLLAGETLPIDLARAWRDWFPLKPALFNLYGPTESVLATYYAVEALSPEQPTVPIGRAIDGRQILILDRAGQLCPIGVPGELYIRSAYLTDGYFRRPDETRKAFLQNPLHADYPDRVYRTGDLARWLADGSLEFYGRIDRQLKIGGIRVEPAEIEAVLAQHTAVRECAVVAQEYEPAINDRRLIAYVVAPEQPSAAILRSFLRQSLPESLIPTAFVFLEALPRTPNGKINHRELPRLERSNTQSEEPYTAPRTPLEQFLSNTWQVLLQVDRVGIHDNFFDLGGNSLLAMQVVNKLREKYAVDLSLRSFFELPTIAGVADRLGSDSIAQPPEVEKIARIMKQLSALSRDELDALLKQKRHEARQQEGT